MEAASPPPPVAGASSTQAGALARVAGLVVALILAFLAAVAIVAMLDIGDLTPCDDVTNISQLNADGECFDGSSTTKTISLILGWPGAALGVISVLLTLGFVIRGRGARTAALVFVGGAALFGLAILAGSI